MTSVRLDSLTDTSSIVEIVYKGSSNLNGVELMGVDAGLSWLKGKSIVFTKSEADSEEAYYSVMLNITESCEFRARGYDSEEDHWEDGMTNHRIVRNENGSIRFQTHLDSDQYYFKGSVPLEYNPDIESVIHRIDNIRSEQTSLFQILVDLSVWVDTLMDNPLEENKIHPIPYIVTFLKKHGRAFDSQLVDGVVRPAMKSLYHMYRSAMDFAEDDSRLLTSEWEQEGHLTLIKSLPDLVKELDNNPNLGHGKDSFDRFRELLNYVS